MASIVRVSRDNTQVVVRDETTYSLLSTKDYTIKNTSNSLAALLASGSWRMPIEDDTSTHSNAILACKKIKPHKTAKEKLARKMRIPTAVVASIRTLSELPITLPDEEASRLQSMRDSGVATLEDLRWFSSFVTNVQQKLSSLDSPDTLDWVERTLTNNAITASGFEPSDDLEYFVAGDVENSSKVNRLLAVPVDDKTILLSWSGDKFVPLPEAPADFEAPSVFEVTEEDAIKVADWISANNGEEYIDIADFDEEERNLALAAFSYIDWNSVEAIQGIMADASGYSPLERSQNAQRQIRSNDGRFGGPQLGTEKTADAVNSAPTVKAHLRAPHPLIINPSARIEKYMAEIANATTEAPVIAAGPPSNVKPLYLAIVDSVDNTAVLDMLAIAPSEDGNPTAWKREKGNWISAPDSLEDLRGITPPPVVELTDETEIKQVLSDIDIHDSGAQEPVVASGIELTYWECTDYTRSTRMKDSRSGKALADGSYPIHNVQDLKNAIRAYGRANEEKRAKVRKHIIKRARGLGRPDLIPSEWTEASVSVEHIALSLWELTDYSRQTREEDARKGVALPDGSYPIHNSEDLKNAIQAIGRSSEEKRPQVRMHIRKRAKALNRPDLIPDSWSETALNDMLFLHETTSPLYSPTGEVLLAGGVPGVADAPEDFMAVRRLKNYWLYGRGGAKINWANPKGNMTRCIRHLSKYMPGRAGGYCQELHKEFYGATNAKVDKAAGLR